ncbi:hypothetical protein KIM372_11640 [Bombiscardovia nodaiensis]|uniref:Abi-like protein n=1 Tax=Bombiscardovia nodaiensis TaxID=2932181 RepID=A0ABM8B8P3_9BIFI|nr:hypothetical protein KIM372_11640 [Bombiscardovia nodaiensis]
MDESANQSFVYSGLELGSDEAFRLFGRARLQVFLRKENNLQKALQAYSRQLHLGQVLLKPIGITEVFIRNAVDTSICEWWKTQQLPGDWLDDWGNVSVPGTLPSFCHIPSWRRRAAANCQSHRFQGELSHDDVLAHMMLGTWRNMIGNPLGISAKAPADPQQLDSWKSQCKTDRACAHLWKEILSEAFPNIPTKSGRRGLSPRAYIGASISSMAGLRNRVCHWDSLFEVNVEARYRDMTNIVGAISVAGLQWMLAQTQEEILQVLQTD